MWKRRVGVSVIALVSAVGLTFTSPDEAAADCVYAEVHYEVLGGGEQALVHGCVVPTPINNQSGQSGPFEAGDPDIAWTYYYLRFPLP